ncbi:hamartin-like isoform X2 [Aphidius gifuensis]|uniref:hamartin-like isoform X2 n=1 Tax=Aphidius gifuensis TaxID=684658 RepID=UPI001CDC2003|nr:hamartin-like isoform X2 [Aphidius gifuensis]
MFISTGVAELFHLLESNKLSDVEEIKKVFHDHFLSTKDNWLVNGLFDYYLSTNSLRAIEVLAGVREPHDKHLLDRLCECFSRTAGNECHEKNEQRIHALTLLGHVARRQPTWLYKLANHQLFKELLKLLKQDTNTLSLMSALLLLVTLLPMLPAALGPHLNDIFDIFGRLSYYHCHQSLNFTSSSSTSTSTTNSNNFSYNMDNNQLYLLHLQIGLNSLFHRLYAMYPCNFISYLKIQYLPRDQDPTFNHTIKPMLDSVRLHPLLVTASKDAEINATRWKKMEHHDVVAECGRFALDKSKEDNCFTITNDSRATPIQDHLISQNLSHNLIIGTHELSEASINGPDLNKNCHNNKKNDSSGGGGSVCVDNSFNNNENSDGCDNNNHKVVVDNNNNDNDDDDDEDKFWSPSMTVSPHSPPPPPTPPTPTPPPSPSLSPSPSPPPISLPPPPPLSLSSSSSSPPPPPPSPSPSSILQIIPSLETSSTPNNNNNNNNKINSSPPEAAVEATPETTPVKDIRGQNTINTCLRQSPLVGSPAVRALSTFSNNLITSASSLTFSPHNLHNHLNNNNNNNLSRPSTPITTTNSNSNNNNNNNTVGNLDTLVSDTSILSQKINRLFVDRQNFVQSRKLIFNSLENGGGGNKMTNDSWNADQEISDIHHNLHNKNLLIPIAIDDDEARGARVDLTKKVRRLRFHSQCADSMTNVERSKSCPNINKVQDNNNSNNNNNNGRIDCDTNQEINNKKIGRKNNNNNNNLVESSTQTINILPYKHLLTYLLDQRNQEQQQQQQQQLIKQNSRSSPTAMLDRYIERCSFKISNTSFDEKNKIQTSTIPSIPLAATTSSTTTTTTTESPLPTTEATTTTTTTAVDESNDETTTTLNDDSNNSDYAANQQFQLMHMQLLFERQRREVHAERNRRLLGKLRDSRALEELNGALTHQLRQAVKDIDELKCEIKKCKKDGRLAEERYTEALNHWQLKCVDEQQKNKILKQHSDILELELKSERKKLIECGEKNKITEATLFDAANQLKHALKAANQSEELKKTLDNVQKKFLLLGEAQTKLQELNIGPISMNKQEAVLIQRAYNEELSNLRRQFDARTSLIDALKVHIVELENKEIQNELHLTEQQRHIQELKEKNECELDAVESKYRAQVEINLLLETTILKLHGELELIKNSSRRIITSGASGGGGGCGTTSIHLGSSVSPKSGSLASSSEGSLAFHSGIGIISDCQDSSGEISNLQAIIEPTSLSSLSNNQ